MPYPDDCEVTSEGPNPSTSSSPALNACDVRRLLGLPAEAAAWLERLELCTAPSGPVLPDDAEAASALEQLGVDPGARAATLAARPDPIDHPALWWLLERLYEETLASMGHPVSAARYPRGWPALPAETGDHGRHLYVWVFLASLPHVRRYHADRSVPDDVSWNSLAELGEAMARHREHSGKSGLGEHWALPLIFRGAFYTGLGRLAFDRHLAPNPFNDAPNSTTNQPPRPGEPVVNLHIPGNGQPLDPDACEESIQRIRQFVIDHFPERPVAFICHSWLLDDQLTAYLPETSNIVRFQRRFNLVPNPTDGGDRPMLELIFKRDPGDTPELPPQLIDQLPQDTTLQRAFVTHLRHGDHWYNRTGWFPF